MTSGPGSVRVIGVTSASSPSELAEQLAWRVVVARSAGVLASSLPAGITIRRSFDASFEAQPQLGTAGSIAEEIAALALNDDVAYLVPGPGVVGDSTVAALQRRQHIDLVAGLFVPVASVGNVQIIDALDLAEAEAANPFDAGLAPLDPTHPTIVTNWYGSGVIEAASRRLFRLYGIDGPLQADADACVHLPPRAALDGPASATALQQIVSQLRAPGGCPWDREQTAMSMLSDFEEELQEFRAAVESGDWDNAREELGDILLHVLMQSQMAAEAGHFRFEDVLSGINAKLVRRHPHVFAGVRADTAEEVLAVWQQVKRDEKKAVTAPSTP